MKIALVTGNYWPRLGGAEAHVKSLATELAKENVVAVFSLDNPSHELVIDPSSNVWIFRASRGISLKEIIALPGREGVSQLHKGLDEFAPDVVCTFTRFYLTTTIAQKWARKRGVAHVHSELGGGYVHSSSSLVNLFSYFFDHAIGKRILKNSLAVIGLSREAGVFLRKWAKVDAFIVGNGIDIDFWGHSKTDRVLSIEPDNFKREFLFVGRLVPEKGLPTLLGALRKLAPIERENVILNIVVPADQLKESNLGKEYSDIAKNLRISPSPSRNEIRELYGRCVYLNPSTAGEGFQTTLLEASASGCYIYSNNVGGAVETIPSDNFGKIFFDNSIDNWVEVFRNSSITGSDRIDTSSIVNNFGWGIVANRYRLVFEDALHINNQS